MYTFCRLLLIGRFLSETQRLRKDLEGLKWKEHRLFVHRRYQAIAGIALASGSARRSGVDVPVPPSCPVMRHISRIASENYQNASIR